MLRTPLTATLGVILGMLLLMIPLQRLTSARPSPAAASVGTDGDDHVAAWASLRLLTPAESMVLRHADGQILWSSGPLDAGEQETRLNLPPLPGHVECILEITFKDDSHDTAAFLTLAPDGFDEMTCHAIGRGRVHELLRFAWSDH